MEKPIQKQSKKIKKDFKQQQQNYPKHNFDIEIFQDHSQYDFDELAIYHDPLEKYVYINNGGMSTINFQDPQALKTLTQAILLYKFNLQYWDIPIDSLCPTIPSRLNYLNLVNELLVDNIQNWEQHYENENIEIIDIGTGSNLIYALLGTQWFNWKCTATEILTQSYNNAKTIIEKNNLSNKITLIHNEYKYNYQNTISEQQQQKQEEQEEENQNQQQQKLRYSILKNTIPKNKHYFLSVCNPPFYSDQQQRRNVDGKNSNILDNENYVPGGEIEFIYQYIEESEEYKDNIVFFTSLVGVKSHFFSLKDILRKLRKEKKISNFYTGRFKQGKNTRWVIAWTYRKNIQFKTNDFDNY